MELKNILDTLQSILLYNDYTLLVSTLILSYFVAFLLNPVLFYFFDFISSKTKAEFDDELFKILRKPSFYSISILISMFVFAFGANSEKLVSIVSKILLSLLIVVWVKPVINIGNLSLVYLKNKRGSFVKEATLHLFKNVWFVIVWSFAIYFLFFVWGISLTAWLASAGIVGIAVGFAAKDTLSNLIAGIFILADAPYKVGDIIMLDSGEKGEVIHVGLRSTRIKTFDGVEVTIPNAQMGNSKIMNETGSRIDEKIRARIPVGISYEDDISKAEEIMLKIASEFEEVCKDPEPQVKFIAFGPSSLDLELRIWLPNPKKRSVIDKIMRRILDEFRKNNIEIPYSKQDLYIKEFPCQKS